MSMLPLFHEYMGHSSFSETVYHIHVLPENKSVAIDWDKFNTIFPETIE